MKKEDIFLVILALVLLFAMIMTIIKGGARSRHGYGAADYPREKFLVVGAPFEETSC